MSDQEEINKILDEIINGKKIRDMSAFEFIQFCLSKLNNVNPYRNYEVGSLSRYLNSQDPKIVKIFANEIKLDIIKRLKDLGVY